MMSGRRLPASLSHGSSSGAVVVVESRLVWGSPTWCMFWRGLLSTRYRPSAEEAFRSVGEWMDGTRWGWWVRGMHAAGASFLMAALALHASRSVSSAGRAPGPVDHGVRPLPRHRRGRLWGTCYPGETCLWAATVITGLAGTLPGASAATLSWLWGSAAPGTATLGRFCPALPGSPGGSGEDPFICSCCIEKGPPPPRRPEMPCASPWSPEGSGGTFQATTFGMIAVAFVCHAPDFRSSGEPMARGPPGHPRAHPPRLVLPAALRGPAIGSPQIGMGRGAGRGAGGALGGLCPVRETPDGRALVPCFWIWAGLTVAVSAVGARPPEEPFLTAGRGLGAFWFAFGF
uniref:Cytochrome b n=1 Tax=Leucosolenia complicata TaxID=433461 RepID=A0A140CUS5_9METZ|nr:apocytochrome b [Leucosolenia complicata]